MYLYKKTYVQNWDHMTPEEKTTITVRRGGKILKGVNTKKITYLVENAGYWRKANQIHSWFVQNVQDGEDDCQTYYVSREKLGELLAVVRQVLEASELIDGEVINGYNIGKDGERKPIMEKGKYIKDSSVAAELLPNAEGFFFGSTEYDQYYYDDLKLTEEMLVEALSDDSDADFEYHSSW